MTTKKITLELVGLDSNAFVLVGTFRRQAWIEGWTTDEIREVTAQCMSGSYDHILATLADHCVSPGD